MKIVLTAVDILDDEDRAVERVQLEVLELLIEHRRVEQETAVRIFEAPFNRVHHFRRKP